MRTLVFALPLALLVVAAGCALPTPPPPSLPPATPLRPSPADAVYAIVTDTGGCSGVAIEPHVLVTAGHCVDAMRGHPTLVALGTDFGGPGLSVSRMWRVPEPADIGLMRVDGTLPVTVVTAPVLPRAGERLTLVGFGCESKWPPFTRSERGADAFGAGGGLVLFDGVVCHGDSGGAVFNRDGALLAVMVAGFKFLPDAPEVNAGTLIAESLPGLLDVDFNGTTDPPSQ